MIVNLVKIGNSKGLRIPNILLKQCNIEDKLDLTVEDGKIVLSSAKIPRSGWRESFMEMNANNDDNLLVEDTLDTPEDWEWK